MIDEFTTENDIDAAITGDRDSLQPVLDGLRSGTGTSLLL
jgi:hypothetical protein